MSDTPRTILLYALTASLAAVTLAYIFGPSLYPNDNYQSGKAGAVGLSNPANDCFINSVLQALAGCAELRRYLVEEELRLRGEESNTEDQRFQMPTFRGKEESLRAGIFTLALARISRQLNERPIYKKTISAREFVSSLEKAFGNRINRRQQDAQEFLQHVAERLSDEYHTFQKSSNISEEGTANTSFILEGQTESKIRCQTCQFTPKPNMSTFVTLTLNVPHQFLTTLDACFDGMLKQEFIDDYACDHCRLVDAFDPRAAELANPLRTNPATVPNLLPIPDIAPRRRISKWTRISSYPKVLSVHLSRSIFDSSSFSTKNTAKVTFEETLLLGGFDRKKYRLAAVVTHRGGHDSGHYETFRRQAESLESVLFNTLGGEQKDSSAEGEMGNVKAKKKRKVVGGNMWWRISDDKIGECKTKDVLAMQREVYLLFYELVQNAGE